MMDMDFTFEPSPWEAFLRTKQLGDTVTAGNLLAMLEGEDDQALEDAFQDLEMGCLVLSVRDLPRAAADGASGVRLRREAELVKTGLRPELLEEGDPLRLYLEEIAAIPAFGDEQLLAQECAAGKESAMVPLTNLGLSRVIGLAGEYVGYGVLLMDLIQEGSLGLWQAICSYSGGDYEKHRDKWIHFYLGKAVTVQARNMGVGQRMRTALEDYRQIDERLLAELGKNPSVEEIAAEMHMSVEAVYTVKKMLEDARALARNQKTPEPEQEEEEADQAVENTTLFQMRQRILDLLSCLSDEDSRILTLRFGLEGGLPLSVEETAARMGLTPEEVTAREHAALAQLRNQK